MNDFISLRYLLSLIGSANGVAALDASGKLSESVLPPAAFGAFLGDFADLTSLQTAHPNASTGQYGTISGTKYYWNAAMSPPGFTSVEITIAAYNALTDAQKNGQPGWLIIP